MKTKRKRNPGITPFVVIALIIVTPLLLISSCDYDYLDGLGEIEVPSIEPVFAVPLVNSTLKVNNIFNEDDFTSINVDEEGLVTIIYSGEVFSLPASSIFQVEDQHQTITYNNITPGSGGAVELPPKLFLVTFENSEILTYISFLEGTFNVTVYAPELQQDGYNLEATFRILNSFDSNNQPFSGQVNLYEPSHSDLTGGRIEFDNESNFFMVEYIITISGDGNPQNAPYTIEFINTMDNIRFDLAKGYIDQINFPIGNIAIPINMFSNAKVGSIMFEDPSIDFTMLNSFGTDIDINIMEFYATTIDDETIQISGEGVDSPWRAAAPGSHEEVSQKSYMVLDPDNTNLFEITEQSPVEFYYNVRGLTNPDGTMLATNWIKHDSNLSINMEMNLPLWGRIDYLLLEDTTTIALGNMPDELEWVELKMNIANGFPLDLYLNVILLDENNQHLDTLFNAQPKLFEAAQVDPATSIVTQPGRSTLLEMIDDQKTWNLRNASKLFIEASLNTYDHEAGTTVKILDTYEIGLERGLRAKTIL